MSENQNKADDVVTETAGEAAQPAAGEVTDHVQLAALLEDARGKADEHWDQCLRLRADLENMHKRSKRELANAHKYSLEKFARELLPVRDSLELGLAAASEEHADAGKVREGVELTLQMLNGALDKFAIQEIDPQDEPFNPEFHQAMSMQERADVEPGTVVTVVQKGYLLHDRLIRPAMVIVSQAPAADRAQ